MKAIAYIRVSTTEQAEDGVSLEAQRAKIEAWATLHDADLVNVYMDAGVSGTVSEREGLDAALDAAVRHKAVLVVYSLSRLSRSTAHTLTIAERLADAGADLVSLSEKIDTTSAAGRMVFRMLAVLAEFERDQLSERTKAALAHKKQKGERVGSVPHGFRVDAEDPKRLVADTDEQETKRLVAELRGQGMTLRAISAELASRGVFNRAGRPFNPKSLASMLAAA